MVDLETLTSSVYTAPRPPTPPREINDDPPSGAFDRVLKQLFRRSSGVTPQSSFEGVNTPTTSAKKSVGWADLSGHNGVPQLSVNGNQIFSSPALSLPSTERKTPKSILKATSYNDLSGLVGIVAPTSSFAKMLESTLQQLEGHDRVSKVDAYVILAQALKATDNVPDLRALHGRMEKLLGYVKRDILEKDESGEEASMAVNALVLFGSFFHNPSIVEMIPTEFALWIVDFSVKTFEDVHASKDVARHLMFILAKQTFSPQVMSKDRVNKLINVLSNISNTNLASKRIYDGRMNIYRTLLRQSKPHMLSNHVWLGDLLTDMTSKYKDTRVNAITFGLEAAYVLGAEPKITRAVMNVFAAELPGKGKYGDFYINKLRQMSQTDVRKDSTMQSAVPQIWSVIIMFFRGRLQSLERWEYLPHLLKIISGAFNGSDLSARREALLAWNRFIYVVHTSESSSPIAPQSNLAKLLPQALEGQLRRSNMRAYAQNSLCCLLYYSLSATNTASRIELNWNHYVVRLVGDALIPTEGVPQQKKGNVEFASEVLRYLFDIESPRTWNENRIMENKFPAQELTPLDSKWLRKNAEIVFPIIQKVLEVKFLQIEEDPEVMKMWNAYLTSITLPAAKEIKVSNDTMTSLAMIFGFLHNMWRHGPSKCIPRRDLFEGDEQNSSQDPGSISLKFLNAFAGLSSTLIQQLGILPFTDRQLCMGVQNTFTPIATPSHKPDKLRGDVRTPLYHLIVLLATVSPGAVYDHTFTAMVQKLLHPFFAARKSKSSRVELGRIVLEMLPAENTEPLRQIWTAIAGYTTTFVNGPDSGRDQPLGAVYKEVTSILEFGITLARNEPAPRWESLYNAMAEVIVRDAGDAGKAIALIEPLAAALVRKDPAITPLARLLHFQQLVGSVAYPRDKRALDAATKKIWGVAAIRSHSSSDPFVQLYGYMNTSLQTAYNSFNSANKQIYSEMLISTSTFLKRCPPSLFFGVLRNLQQAVGTWIQNADLKFSGYGGDQTGNAVASLWISIIGIITELYVDENHSNLLAAHSDFLCCALESKQKTMVNSAIGFWNITFGQSNQDIVYPERLQVTLLQLRTATDILLPSLPASLLSDPPINERQPLDFEETQFDFGSTIDMSGLSSPTKQHLPPSPLRNVLRSSPSGRKTLKRSSENTPERQRKSRKRDTTPRLRHDDSQIQFQPIESSPIVDKVVDSQMLTDRQKEVRERQLADGMFQNIGSSPSRKRRDSAADSDQELPIHRSSSQSSLLRVRTREETPVLVTPSDDIEEFITSSPTPTRSIKSGAEDDEPGSSPPQAPVEMDLDDIPSSPIEYLELQDMEVVVEPLEHVEKPAIAQTPAVISTYGSTIDFAFTEPQAVIAGTEQVEVGLPQEQYIQLAIPVEIDDTAFDDSESSPEIEERPTTPVMRINVNEVPGSPPSPDVFVDAVSSPPPQVDEFDDSSMIRALVEVDENRTATPKSGGVFKPPESRPSSSKSTPQVIIPRTLSKPFEINETPAPKKTRGHRPSTPFHIPETPAHGPTALELSHDILDTDPSLTPENTIIFNNPALWDDETSSRLQNKSNKVFTGQKRKFDLDDGNQEIDNNQASIREGSVVSSTSSIKRGRGRPRKSDVELIDSTVDSPTFQAVSQTSKSTNPQARGRPRRSPRQSQDVFNDEIAEVEAQLSQDIDMMASEIPETSSVDPITMTSGLQSGNVEEGLLISLDIGAVVPETVHKERQQDRILAHDEGETADAFETSKEEFLSSNNDDTEASSIVDATKSMIEEARFIPSNSAVKPPFSIFGTVREQLQALMNTIRGGSLSRAETVAVEDDLNDVKEALYGAARRGRNRLVGDE